ncbi:RimJ/RimL family protein N-acetyltransferase [Phenylobacterium haematophilum]|uniref:RimJ/RimL family protein N-acetyltransferase n=1 Tax=Phenylobacterium haematophilum TaxID=98513 RepID=A0A840A4F7_9CAUL|nr:GNAT family N-acetyltransferase [Phenylobacterium haematophilum]MBB3892553.1 RimJ/RimL family protein N-acetyltransferase [Phenylobacterium haematophilum]
MSLGPTLETARLLLRPTSGEDFEPWAAFSADEEASRFLGGPQPREAAWRMMCTMAGSWVVRGFGMFSVIEKESGRWVGRLGPWQPEGWPGTEVGWGVAREFWGRGYATEGATAAIDWAFDHLGWTEVIHCIDPGNVNSQAVARRLGSSLLRHAMLPPPISESVDVWGQSREQWRSHCN